MPDHKGPSTTRAPRRRRGCFGQIAAAAAFAIAPLSSAAHGPTPSVASVNLCADQLVLVLADPEQILTLSWLSADPEESLLAATAARYPLNYGTAEELLHFSPDLVIAGAYTSGFTRALLARLGYRVLELKPETTIAEIEANVLTVAEAVGHPERGKRLVASMRAEERTIDAHRPAHAPATVVVRPGGFTVGKHSLADELLTLAGMRNVAAEQGLDRWGSLSMEALLRSAPELIVLTGYRLAQPSLANMVLEHPALARLKAEGRTATVPAAYWACGLPQSLESVTILQHAAQQ
jgi:iron complex transport system substrate-binding protein